jgi:hypothetical protein
MLKAKAVMSRISDQVQHSPEALLILGILAQSAADYINEMEADMALAYLYNPWHVEKVGLEKDWVTASFITAGIIPPRTVSANAPSVRIWERTEDGFLVNPYTGVVAKELETA